MAETWYFRDGAGAACGPGTRRDLQQSPGAAATTQDVSSEHTWNRTEAGARSIQSGNWSVSLDLTTGAGGGAPNKVTVVVERRNSSCVVQQTILNVESGNLNAGTTEEILFGPIDPGQVDFAAGDILTVRVVRSNGGRTQDVRFNGASGGDADSRLDTPDVLSTDRRGQLSWGEIEVPDAPRRGVVSWAELETPDAARRGQVSFAEMEIPDGARRGVFSWGEIEVPDAPRRGVVSWAEMQVPNVPGGSQGKSRRKTSPIRHRRRLF